MSKATAVANSRSRQEWAEIINTDWRKSIDGIIQTGRDLQAAKDELVHGEFEAMIREDLPFGLTATRALMRIARNPKIANRRPADDLPPSWSVLEQLASLSEADFTDAVKRGLISSDTDRASAKAIRRAYNKDNDDVVGDPTKNQRDLPTPSEARKIARETNRFVAASDGHIYSGATVEEGEEFEQRQELTYGIKDAIHDITSCDLTPTQWLEQAEDYWLQDLEIGPISEAIDWLTALRSALAKQRKTIDAV